jgi:hypothetical protein
MWYKVRLLEIPGRKRLPKLRANKSIHFKKEINGIIEIMKGNKTGARSINH